MDITRDIYGMPAFVTFTVTDLRRTVDWYTDALDFITLFTMPGGQLVHLRRWRYQDILVRQGGPTAGGHGTSGGHGTYSIMATVEQLDRIAQRARTHGGGSVDGPVDTPWNTRDLRVTDPDGYTVVYTALRPENERDERFSAMMHRESKAQLGGEAARDLT